MCGSSRAWNDFATSSAPKDRGLEHAGGNRVHADAGPGQVGAIARVIEITPPLDAA
jgi:hypothetical protein